MLKKSLFSSAVAALFASLCLAGSCGGELEPEILSATPSYDRDIKPIFNRHCVEYHDGDGVRDGGVELDRYESAFAGRIKNVCVSITSERIEQFRAALLPQPKDPPVPEVPCNGWEPYSMPVGAKPKLTAHEQLILIRWVEIGGPR